MTHAAPTPDEALAHAQDELADIFGNIAAFWGFTRTQGRIYGLLFLSPKPLGHAEIRERLGISAGSASMTLASLVHWGVLRRHGRLYAPETDMWKVITGVFRRREKEQVLEAIDRADRLLALLDRVEGGGEPIAFVRRRVEQLRDFFSLGRDFLDAFVTGRPISSLLTTIAKRAAKFALSPEQDASFGP